MIIGLSGYARSGKDEVAKILVENYGYKRLAFADPIRKFLLKVNPILDSGHRLEEIVNEFNWTIAKSKTETRRLLQEVGVTAREMFGENIWVEPLLEEAYFLGNVVVPDVRFPNELESIKLNGGKVYRVTRPSVQPVNSHISEVALDGAQFDGYIPNEGTLEDLRANVMKIMEHDAHQTV